MPYSIRVMEERDVTSICHLLNKVFGELSPIYPNWREIIEWLYFSEAIKDRIPRALVIADEQMVVGHIGLTLSEFTNGDISLKVVQTANWLIDPDSKVGLLSLRIFLEAISLGKTAFVIGGSEDTHRVIPKIGFRKRLDVDRFIKVINPVRFLSMSRSSEVLARNVGKLMLFAANSAMALSRFNGESPRLKYQMVESNSSIAADPPHSMAGVITPKARHVLRNTLGADFLNWYKQYPLGDVHVLRFYDADTTLVGQAAVLIQSRKGNRYANLLNVDTFVNDPSAWSNILEATENFLREKGVSHINTLATYEPWRRALIEKGYCRVNRLPLWVRDKDEILADVEAWHITAIEGDLGYLFE